MLRIIAGSLCIIVAILRILTFFFELGGTILYSFLFITPNQTVDLFEGLVIVFFAIFATIFFLIIAVAVYVVLGILQIVLRSKKTPSIICNLWTLIGIFLSIRVFILLASLDEFSILLTILAIFYITIFSLCILSYMEFRKEG